MSLFNRLQKAFGFEFDDDPQDEQDEVRPTPSYYSVEKSAGEDGNISEISHESAPSDPIENHTGSDNIDASVIFEGVVEVLNRELPPYLRDNLNSEGQRQYLLENLDIALKKYIQSIGEEERKKIERSRETDKDRLKKNFEGIKERLQTTEEQLAKEAEKSLSAERQKRALSLRIRDLESKIGSLEAEKEQYELENRSLLNKLRVAEVTGSMNAHVGEDGSANEEYEVKLKDLEDKLASKQSETEGLIHKLSEFEKLTHALEVKLKENEAESKRMKTKIEELGGMIAEKDMLISQQNQKMEDIQATYAVASETSGSSDYEFISFENVVSAPANESVQDGIQQGNSEEPEKKHRGRPKKNRSKEKNDILDDTDWLIEASEHMDNPDRVVAENKNNNDTDNGFPSQMSLW